MKNKELKTGKKNNIFKRTADYLSTTKLNYYLHKTISPKNTYLVAIVVIGLFIVVSYFSYAMFTVYQEKQRVLTMQAGSLSLSITSEDLNENSSITLGAKEANIIEINVTNNSMTKVKADLNYTTTNNNIVIKYLDELNSIIPDANGDFKLNNNTTKKAIIILYNNSDEEGTVTFNKDIGLENSTLTGENTVLNQTTNDPYTVIGLTNTLANKIYSDNTIVKSLLQIPNIFNSNNEQTGLYRYKDSDGTFTYFFRGINPDNYVDFAGSTWRILRIQEDGTIKLIKEDALNFASDRVAYDKGTYKQVKYNNSASSDNDSKYVGSNIKAYVEEWYSSEMSSYDSKIVTNAYCSDRTEDHNSMYYNHPRFKILYPEVINFYGVFNRFNTGDWTGSNTMTEVEQDSTSWTPSISCTEDIINTKAALITADEFILAGGGNGPRSSSIYLLKQDYAWWTMSPSMFGKTNIKDDSILARVDAILYDYASFVLGQVSNSASVRPVITLKADITNITGNGTSTSPYVIN